MSASRDSVPFKVLIFDHDAIAAGMLADAIARVDPSVTHQIVPSIDALLNAVDVGVVGTIFIDPFSIGLDESTAVILNVRESHPWITFVLYFDVALAERHRAEFYRGNRSRFSHYYKLDKATPLLAFDREVESTLLLARRWAVKHSYKVAVEEFIAAGGKSAAIANVKILASDVELLPEEPYSRRNSVFLSHRFAEIEFVDGLQRLLEQNGFVVVKGDSTNTFVSQAVLQRIKDSEFVLCLMRRADAKTDGTYATSGWRLEEKRAPLACGKPVVLRGEDGVSDIGGLQGDW